MPTRYPGTPAETRALNAHIKLMRAAGTLKARLDRWVMAHGLTESQFGVLETLFHLGPLSPSAISQKRLSSGANITTVLDNLEKRELIRRDPSETDGRCSRVQLRPEGRRLIARIFPAHVTAIRLAYAALSAEEQETLGMLSRKLGLANVEAPSRRGSGARRGFTGHARRVPQAGRK